MRPAVALRAALLAALLPAAAAAQTYEDVIDEAGRLIQSGDAAAAVPALRSLKDSATGADIPRASNALGFALYSAGELEAAIPELEEAAKLALGNGDVETYVKASNNLGLAYYTMGDYTAAEQVFEEASRHGSGLADEYLGLIAGQLAARSVGELTEEGIAAFFERDYDRALTLYDEALSLAPDNARVLNLRGYLHLRRGEVAEAVSDLTRAVSANPEGVIPRINLLKARCVESEGTGAPLPADLAPRSDDERETYEGDGELRRLCGDRLTRLIG